MKIAIVGYGKMGQLIEEIIHESSDHEVSNIICRDEHDPLTAESLEDVDVAIDFSHGSLMEEHVKLYCQAGVSAIIGTTGWNTYDTTLIDMVEDAGISVIVGSNFSAGTQSFIQVVRDTAERLTAIGGYDVYIQDVHHAHKADSPSGTARTIAEAVLETFPSKTDVTYGQVEGQIAPETLQVVSVRGGLNAGLHQVTFDGPDDSITLTHAAHSRRGFAAGAVAAIDELKQYTGWTRYEDLFKKERV